LSFSKDGQWVAYASYPDGTLWRSRTDGSERLQLSVPPMAALSPQWSPDGNFIVALSDTHHALLLDLKAETKTELTKMTAAYPVWSRDGKYVYFSSTDQAEPAFYRVNINNRKVERVVSLKEVKRPTSASWGSWTGLTPNDEPLALRDISTYEIYALEWELP